MTIGAVGLKGEARHFGRAIRPVHGETAGRAKATDGIGQGSPTLWMESSGPRVARPSRKPTPMSTFAPWLNRGLDDWQTLDQPTRMVRLHGRLTKCFRLALTGGGARTGKRSGVELAS